MADGIYTNATYLLASCVSISAFFLTDILLLRSLYLLASLLFVVVGIQLQLTVMICVNLLVMSVNLMQIVRLLLERTTVLIPAEFVSIYTNYFASMLPREFLYFINSAKNKICKQGELILVEGDTRNTLVFVIEGVVAIEVQDKVIAKFNHNCFLGEFRFFTEKPISANVRCITHVNYFEWDYKVLEKMKHTKSTVYIKLLTILGNDLVAKIQLGMGEIKT